MIDVDGSLQPVSPLRVALDAYSEVRAERDSAGRAFTRGDHARAMRAALEAAEPVILAAYRENLLADAFPDEDSDHHYGCERLLDLVRDGIPPEPGATHG